MGLDLSLGSGLGIETEWAVLRVVSDVLRRTLGWV